MSVRVLLVDDQAPFRAAARAVVARAPGFELVAEAGSADDATRLAAELRPDLVLMDINLGDVDGIEATRRLLALAPGAVVVLLSSYSLEDLPAAARSSGAVAYVHKDELSPGRLRRIWEEPGAGAWAGA